MEGDQRIGAHAVLEGKHMFHYEHGVPVTLAVISAPPENGSRLPLLKPYPNWDMQKNSDNCSTFQRVLDFKIGPNGRMWILDSGTEMFSKTINKDQCLPRLVILDLEDGGKILTNYIVPSTVIDVNFIRHSLTNLMLDHDDGDFAYFTDNLNMAMVVFSLALSPVNSKGDRVLYYVALFSDKVSEISTDVLKSQSLSPKISQWVRELDIKIFSIQAEILVSNTGIMYIKSDPISWEPMLNIPPLFYETSPNIIQIKRLKVRNNRLIFDQEGNLCFINRFSSKIQTIKLKLEESSEYYWD
ncbi:protein yellow-like [Copidosoma floridanum]|uniref:protein yellow-like n=1 Tax=Copidosoma floridanum TaxID=29053 RepID=UPI0006C96522|nr:protein yellow-like [Copidosoma floridanum]